MNIRFTNSFLTKLEDIFAESDYHLRYEKGSFQAGYCILNDKKIVIVNKYYTTEGKVNCLIDILKEINLDQTNFSEKSTELYADITQTELKF